MVNEMKFYYKDYKNAIQIQGINPTYDIDFYFSSKKQYEQFKEDYNFSQSSKLDLKQEGRVEGAKQELESLHKLINNNLNYGHLLIRKQINDLIKKRLKKLESGKE